MENFLTKEGYLKLKQELNFLKKVKRKEIAERIKEAQDFGDISENSELEGARNEQAFLEGKIQKFEYMIKNAQIIENYSTTKVEAGCRVILMVKKKTVEYTLVGAVETDPAQGKISIDSPLGQALYGKTKGEKVFVDTITGPMEYKIIEIR